jgi:hypothetical protein
MRYLCRSRNFKICIVMGLQRKCSYSPQQSSPINGRDRFNAPETQSYNSMWSSWKGCSRILRSGSAHVHPHRVEIIWGLACNSNNKLHSTYVGQILHRYLKATDSRWLSDHDSCSFCNYPLASLQSLSWKTCRHTVCMDLLHYQKGPVGHIPIGAAVPTRCTQAVSHDIECSLGGSQYTISPQSKQLNVHSQLVWTYRSIRSTPKITRCSHQFYRILRYCKHPEDILKKSELRGLYISSSGVAPVAYWVTRARIGTV